MSKAKRLLRAYSKFEAEEREADWDAVRKRIGATARSDPGNVPLLNARIKVENLWLEERRK